MPRCIALLLVASVMAASAGAQAGQERISQAEAEPLFIAALADLYLGDPAQAATRLGDVLVAYPDDPVVLDALAEAYLAQGLAAEALYHAELAASAAPDDPVIQRRLAEAYDATGDAIRAQQAIDTADQLQPNVPSPPSPTPSQSATESAGEEPQSDLPGRAAYRAGRFTEAADALLGVVEDDPRQLEAWALVLNALARASDNRAGDTAEMAVLLYPTVPSILVPAAEAFRSANRPAEARSAAESALRILDSGADDASLRQRADALLSSLR